jgi:hypothetical protein
MRSTLVALGTFVLLIAASFPSLREGRAQEKPAGAPQGSAASPAAQRKPAKVYGQWLIRVRPDKGTQYAQLIKEKGLPLFREAGGRMVGWWKTMIGDLYEHLTIWEYDDMAAFEKAVQFLGKDDRFQKFVEERDPLLTGEEASFLKLASYAEPPALPDTASFVVHETHRVALGHMESYLTFMEKELAVLKSHGFRPLGPFRTVVGQSSLVTYLFRYQSLAEREKLLSDFRALPVGQMHGQKLAGVAEEITTRLLVPAPFAR